LGDTKLKEDEIRSLFVDTYHVTLEFLERVGQKVDAQNYDEAAHWFSYAEYFAGRLAILHLQMKKHRSNEEENVHQKDMYDLMGHLEGAREVLRESIRNT
jgi:hypothetical protein